MGVNQEISLWKKWWVWAIVLVLLGGIGSFGGLRDTTNPTTDSSYYTEPQALNLW